MAHLQLQAVPLEFHTFCSSAWNPDIFHTLLSFFQKEPDISLPRPEVRLLSCIFEYFVLIYPCLYDKQAGKTVWGKGIRLAVIKFIATLIIALCTFSTEMENTMATQIPTTQTSNTLVSTTADRPSTYPKDFYFMLK